MDTNERVKVALEKHSNMVKRICFIYLKNNEEVEDIFQEVFLKLLNRKDPFESEEHEKAWLIRVTINSCKDVFKSFWKKNIESIEDMILPYEDKAESELLKVVLSLPKNYKDVIYLFYYEGYTVPEISKLLNKNENTLYSHLHRAKQIIKERLEDEGYDYTF